MLINHTLDKLRSLRLPGMADALSEQLQHPQHYGELEFTARLGLLVDRETQDRDNRRLARNLKTAHLRSQACIEDLDFHRPRGLDRTQILHLAEAGWVADHRDLLITGPTGAGKTYLACALAQAAIRRGHKACYWRLPRLLDELRLAHADGRVSKLLADWARVDVLILDDLGLRPLTDAQAADLLEVIDDRHGRRATIISSQLPISSWHANLGEPTLADAICDRLTHTAHRIELRGQSLRKPPTPSAATALHGAPATISTPTATQHTADTKHNETRSPSDYATLSTIDHPEGGDSAASRR
jgi:DNA replication protein DnaC